MVILGGAVLSGVSAKEPAYGGKKLSTWLDELTALDSWRGWDLSTEQAHAVRAIGTNALPWLLQWMCADSPRWQWRINQLLAKQPIIKYRFTSGSSAVSRAVNGFRALGELAEPAIPALLSVVETRPGFVPDALAAIGPAAVPALQQCLTNTRSYGGIAVIPGNTIGAIHNALNVDRLSRSNIAVLIPAIREWATCTNRWAGQANYAAAFLRDFDH